MLEFPSCQNTQGAYDLPKQRPDPDPTGGVLTTFDPNKGEFIWLPEEDPVLRNAAGLA